MKIVADENITLVRDYFGTAGELILKPGRSITPEDVRTADMLLVRSVTQVNRKLLEGSSVKFVGSAVTGIDHFDTEWLDAAGIKWYAASGCNKMAVAEYVQCVIAALKKTTVFPDRQLRAGVIGLGKIGSEVAARLKLSGFDVVCCDPVRAAAEPDFVSTPLSDFTDLDLITLQTPLTQHGEFATYHMIGKDFLQRQRKGCVLLNAGRGAVINFSDLEEYGQHLYWCLDVWEFEPHINFEILGLSTIATPHIAGYTLQGKQRGIDMVYQAAVALNLLPDTATPAISYPRVTLSFDNSKVDWCDVLLKIYDPQETTAIMKNALIENGSDATFDLLRKRFQERHEFGFVSVEKVNVSVADKNFLQSLGITFI